ncbi:MAG: glycoside hydrolase 100 family protein [Microcoleus vaginatus WJT46-NPBG5]|jgi:hypothetical protein|nr:glycoside hydrolase 100 family protein [Microcoleus vaginatus WJT46-NPBG5]
MEEEALKILVESLVEYEGRWIGTPAVCNPDAAHPVPGEVLNYDQVFIRDFVPVALLFLVKDDELPVKHHKDTEIPLSGKEIVRNFLEVTLKLHQQARQRSFTGLALMPASFKVIVENGQQHLEPDFGDRAIARVTPVDSSLWWILLLRAYGKAVQNYSLAHQEEFQEGVRLILELCFSDRFDMEPTLLVPDGACMIDRRLGIYGHPLEIQALFYAALRAASELLPDNEANQKVRRAVHLRLQALKDRIRIDYWLDIKSLNDIYRFRVEQYGKEVLNKFNLYSDSIPYEWLSEWLEEKGGYFAGNLGPSQLDCRFFTLANLMTILCSLATKMQSQEIMELIYQQWDKLLAHMPIKICYPALEGRDWEILTGCDPKNKRWSYHNGGSWPVLTWMLAAAALKTGRYDVLKRLKEDLVGVGKRLLAEDWPEYYDGEDGRLIGKEARKFQSWTIAGFFLTQELIDKPEFLMLVNFGFDEDP